MLSSKWNVVAIIGITFALVFVCLVLQFGAAANAVAIFKSEGMTCGSCSAKIERVLLSYGGVTPLRVDPAQGAVIAVFDHRAVDPRRVAAAITSAGFPTQINDLMTMKQFQGLVAGGAGCGSASCNNCDKSR